MKIHKVKTYQYKGDQQWQMLADCGYYWCKKNNFEYPYYTRVMNMKTHRQNDEHECHVALTYHFNPNKW